MDQRALHSFEKLIRLTIDIPPGSAPAPFQPQPFLDQLSAYVTLQRVRKGHTIIRASQVLQDIIMVVEGEFYLLRSSNKGSSSMLARVQAPEIVGQGLLLRHHRQCELPDPARRPRVFRPVPAREQGCIHGVHEMHDQEHDQALRSIRAGLLL